MVAKDLRVILKRVVESVADGFLIHGFEQHGMAIFKMAGGNKAIIDFQVSDKVTRDCVAFTINVGVVIGGLLDDFPGGLAKTGVVDAHLRQRLGHLMRDRRDIWWNLTATTAVDEIVNEISILLSRIAVPFLEAYQATELTSPHVVYEIAADGR